jgi:hypothetical protein
MDMLLRRVAWRRLPEEALLLVDGRLVMGRAAVVADMVDKILSESIVGIVVVLLVLRGPRVGGCGCRLW